MRQVIGIGETIYDIIFKDNQPVKAVPGGSVFNTMISLGRMGTSCSFVSEMGRDRVGELIESFMRSNGLNPDSMYRYTNGATPVSLAFLDNNNNASYQFLTSFPNKRLDITLPVIRRDDIVILGSYFAVNPLLRPQVRHILDEARAQGAIIYYDPNFRPSHLHELDKILPAYIDNLSFADIVRGSNEDFINLHNTHDAKQAFTQHIAPYNRNMLYTRGKEGVDVFDADQYYHYDTPTITPISTIGAGDNFNAGLIYALLKYDIHREDIAHLDNTTWNKLVQTGIDFSTEVCMSFDNYVSIDFASTYNIK